MYCHHNSTCTIRDTTIVGNSATFRGGGLTVVGGASNATVTNTTVSGNIALGPGGGVTGFTGALSLDFVTVAGNASGYSGAGGVDRVSNTLTMRNSIVADNTDAGGTSPDCKGVITSGGYNHVENLTGCTMALGTGDVTGSDPGPADPGRQRRPDRHTGARTGQFRTQRHPDRHERLRHDHHRPAQRNTARLGHRGLRQRRARA